MKKFYLIVLFLLNIYKLQSNPWDLDQETKKIYKTEINSSHQKHSDRAIAEGKKYYLLDFEHRALNFYDNVCPYCQLLKKPTQFHFEEKLNHFFVKRTHILPKAHCWGVALFFVEQLLSNPELLTCSCSEILSKISNAGDFQEKIHCFSMNQHPYYDL